MIWKKLITARNEPEAGMICGLLEVHGVLTQRRYKGIDQYLNIIMGPVATVQIWVPEEQIQEARTILESFSQELEKDVGE